MKPVLLLLDMQNDYLRSPGLEPPAGRIVANAAALLASCRRSGVPVVHVWTTVSRDDDRRMPHWRRAGRWLCVGGTEGHATAVPLRPEPSERVIHKTFFSAFAGGELESALGSLGCDTIWIAGVHLHGCVRSTVLDAYQLGFEVWVAEDAVGSDDPLHAAISRRYLEERAARFLPVASFFADPEPLADAAGPIVSSATRASHQAWMGWRERSPVERSGFLSKLGALLEEEKDSFVRQMAEEIGKPVRYARPEMERALALLRGAIRRADRPLEEGCGPSCRVRRRPLGVVAAVTPWNNPVAIPLGKIAPALLYGNTVVWKPAVEAGAIATRLFDLMQAAGFPDGVVTMVEGGRSSGRALMSDALVDAVSFTGSIGAGYDAQEICARRHVPLQAELGGNNAAIVWSDCDLRHAAWRIAEGAFGFAGQRCTANRRVVVERSCYGRFLGELEQAVEALHWGDPAQQATQVGPLVSAAARDRVAALVSRALPAADRVFTTHKPPPSGCGAYFPPTVICCQDPSHELVLEETFGPVLVVERACDWEEAIRLCNGVAQGLVAALFSESPQRHESFLREVRAGIVKLNTDTAGADAEAPFGGWKASGIGPPEHGDASREFYTRTQVVYLTDT